MESNRKDDISAGFQASESASYLFSIALQQDRNTNIATDKYFGGSTIINGGTTLNYNINVSDTLPSRISGSGTFNKTGSGTLSVTGDQSGFSGIANINGGILNFNKTTTTDKFFAGITNVNANSTLEYTTGINDTLIRKIL